MQLSSLKVDSARVEGGEWIGDIPDMDDLRLHVRGMNNAAYRALYDKLIRAIPFKRRRKGLSAADRERVENECLIETVLLGWDNLNEPDKPNGGGHKVKGAQIPYTKDLARELITNPDSVAFRNAIIYAANIVGEIKDEENEALEKN